MRRMQLSTASFILPLIFCTSGILIGSDQPVLAQDVTAITSSGLNTHVSAPTLLPSGEIMHDITGGTRPGNGPNLFHSFGDFSVGSNNIANFLNDSHLPTSNILARVTGGDVSNIFGTIQTTDFGSANLFLMNPAGFLFGPNATVNVGGMMTFTSSDYLRLADGVRFNSTPKLSADALLSAAPVAAFGFIGWNPGAITVQGSQFSVAPEHTISLVGGNITVQSGTLDNGTVQPARISAPSGQVNLVSVGTPKNPDKGGEVSATDFSLVPTRGFKSLGTVAVTDGAIISASADGSTIGLPGGTVRIRGGELIVSHSSLMAEGGAFPAPVSAGGTIEVHAGTVTLDHATISTSGGGRISTETDNNGSGGPIQFQDLETLTSTASTIKANVHGEDRASKGGSITIGSTQTQSVTLTGTTVSANNLETACCADPSQQNGTTAGDITITGRQLIINGGLLDTRAGGESVRNGGPITLNGNQITLGNQASLLATGDAGFGYGGGTVILQGLMSTTTAPTHARSVTIDNSSIRATGGHDIGGNILIRGDQATLTNATLLAFSGVDGGTINLADVGTLKITNSILDSGSFNVGSGGTIVLGSINTQSIRLQDSTMSVRAFRGEVGTIDITATNLFKSVGSTLDASSAAGFGGSSGNGGTIAIRAGRLAVTDGSTFTAQGAGSGQDGTIQLKYADTLTVKDSVITPAPTIIPGWDGH